MKKKQAVDIQKNVARNKRITSPKAKMTNKSSPISESKKKSIQVKKLGNVCSDSLLNDLHHLSETDESSIEVQKPRNSNRKTISRKVKIPSVANLKNNETSKTKNVSKSNKSHNKDNLSQEENYPINFTKDNNVGSDYELNELDNLSDSDDSFKEVNDLKKSKKVTTKIDKESIIIANPIVKKTKNNNGTPLKDLNMLCDSDESSIEVCNSKISNRKTIKRNIKNKEETKSNDKEPKNKKARKIIASPAQELDNSSDSDESLVKINKSKKITNKTSKIEMLNENKIPTKVSSSKLSQLKKKDSVNEKDKNNVSPESSITTDDKKKRTSTKKPQIEILKANPIPRKVSSSKLSQLKKKNSVNVKGHNYISQESSIATDDSEENVINDITVMSNGSNDITNAIDNNTNLEESISGDIGISDNTVLNSISSFVNGSGSLENNISDDMGINVDDIPTPSTSNGINNIQNTNSSSSQKLPEALLRCAYIQNENSQTVVFWCEELTKWSFKCQNKIMADIRDGKTWVTREIPFASQVAEPQYFLYLYRNNVYMKGIHGTFGIRLFHYTLRTRFQDEVNIKNTARRIVRNVNEDCKANLIFDENRLFLYKKPCVWSNLIGKKGAIEKLIRDTNEVLNDRFSSNPRFWDNNTELIKKFFFINKLQVDVAELLNAPLENIDPCIERTPDLIRLVSLRRNGINPVNTSQTELENQTDPEDEVMVDNGESRTTIFSPPTNTQHINTTENDDPENESTD